MLAPPVFQDKLGRASDHRARAARAFRRNASSREFDGFNGGFHGFPVPWARRRVGTKIDIDLAASIVTLPSNGYSSIAIEEIDPAQPEQPGLVAGQAQGGADAVSSKLQAVLGAGALAGTHPGFPRFSVSSQSQMPPPRSTSASN